jgi:EmrB/QacA subfamily drug resistance transporter
MTVMTASPTKILWVLFFGVLMGALDIAIVGPALPALRAEFAIDERAVAWVFTIYVLFNLVGTPINAKLSDRLGRRAIYVFDVALFAIGSLLVAQAQSFSMLLTGRAIQAFGAGGIFPVASAVIGDTMPAEKRGSALGLIGAVFGVAFLLGPLLAAQLLGFGWRWLFLINLPIAALLILASLRWLPGKVPGRTLLPFDWLGALLISGTLAAMTLGLSALDSEQLLASVANPAVWGCLLAAVLLLLAGIFVENRAPDPVVRPRWFASRQIKLVTLFAAGAGLGESAMVFMPDLAVAGLGITPQASSYLLLSVVVALLFGSPTFGRLLDRIGPKPIIVFALACLLAGAMWVGYSPVSRTNIIIAGALVGLGLSGLLGAPLRYLLIEEVPAAERAAAQGLLTIFTSVGQLLSGALIGAVATSSGGGARGYQNAFLWVAVPVAVMFVMTLLLVNRRSSSAVKATE